jgi:hypothetical protein
MVDVAAILNVSKAHACNLIAGRVRGCVPIPCVPLGRRKLVRRESLLRWIEESEKAGMLTASPDRGRKDA